MVTIYVLREREEQKETVMIFLETQKEEFSKLKEVSIFGQQEGIAGRCAIRNGRNGEGGFVIVAQVEGHPAVQEHPAVHHVHIHFVDVGIADTALDLGRHYNPDAAVNIRCRAAVTLTDQPGVEERNVAGTMGHVFGDAGEQ